MKMKTFRKIRRWLRYNLLYLGSPRWNTGISPPELIHFLENHEPGIALDVGCGTGTNLLTMTEYGWQVVGMDIALLSILRARKKLSAANTQARVMLRSATAETRLDAQFDLVLDIGCFHSLSEKGRNDYRQNLKRWLKPGGHYLLYAHQRTTPAASHGVAGDDFSAFESFLDLKWQTDQDENRPDGKGGIPSTWAEFQRGSEL